ncbi:MAG: baseplate J/gp47 family protein [Catonella sp.]
MFENMTFEALLERMLNRIPDSLDKREGSVIYDAIAPAALEIAQTYADMDSIIDETFADTASRDMLIRRAKERGLSPYPAKTAVIKGAFDTDIPIGERFTLGDLIYKVTEKLKDYEYSLECESTGIEGNKRSGSLIPINYIEGLGRAEITELLIPAEDEEDTEAFRKRYFDTFNAKAYGGNKQDYINRTNAIGGVGATKVIPIWNGGGTVKVVILDSEFNPANNELVKRVQKELDPSRDGTGAGIAPIGHIVTVATVEKVPVNIKTKITFDSGYSFNGLKAEIAKVISAYLLELRKTWAESENITVKISQLNTRISVIKGVSDIEGTTINGKNTNLVITAYSVPVDGEVVNNA